MFSFLDFFEPNRTKTVGLASMNRGPHLVAIVVRILSGAGQNPSLVLHIQSTPAPHYAMHWRGVSHTLVVHLFRREKKLKSWTPAWCLFGGFCSAKIIQFSTVMNAKNLYLLDLVLQGLTHGLISWNCFKFCSQAPFLKGSNWRSTLSVRSHSQYRRTNSSRFL